MPITDCFNCTDCLEHFCSCCDNYGLCPDCGEYLCEDCLTDANEAERAGRCHTCHDPWTSKVEYVGQDSFRKRHMQIRTGVLKDG